MLIICGVALLGFLFYSHQMASSPKPSSSEAVDEAGFPEVDWAYWREVNPDIIAWVTVPGTDISLPVAQAHEDDAVFYLTHDASGSYNIYGCPYLDFKCEQMGFESKISLVYGHHMNDGSMFSAFADFSNEEYLNEHNVILLQTPEFKWRLTVVAADVIDANTEDSIVDIVGSEAAQEWWSDLLSSAAVVTDDAPQQLDKVIAFCTCSYGPLSSNERTLVYAVRM